MFVKGETTHGGGGRKLKEMAEAENRIYFYFCHSGFCHTVSFLGVINPAAAPPINICFAKKAFFHISYLKAAPAVIQLGKISNGGNFLTRPAWIPSRPGEKIVTLDIFLAWTQPTVQRSVD